MPSWTRLLVLTFALLPGCQLLVPDNECPDLDEVCPDLVCENYAQNRDSCSICECEGDDPGAVCWDEADCAAGERCDVVNFCEPAPNCVEGGPCPDACYGRCIEAPSSCTSDLDCREGQICSFFANERPDEERPDTGGGDDPGAPEPDPAPPPAEVGVCQDLSCGEQDVALLECPPGSELVFDKGTCGPVCLPVDVCRELLPQECLSVPGCTILVEGCGCSPDDGACDCANIDRCVAVADCSLLPVEQCESNPSCVLKPIGTEPAPGGDPIPCTCDPNDADCVCDGGAAPPPPEEQLVCVPRGSDGTCLSDADCLAGEVCELTTVCGSGCVVDDDGEEHCFEECWSERGICLASDRTCFDLSNDECLADPRCELGDSAEAPCFCDPADVNCGSCEPPASTCRPREGTCSSDAECLEGQHCELVESCPACDPSSNDIDCLAPCFVEGSCVDGTPPPVSCDVDADCGIGNTCVAVTVCETCDGSGGNGGSEGGARPAPPACDPACREERVCIQTDPVCFADADCGAAAFCDFSQLDCGAAGGLVAQCPGLCVANDDQGLCQEDAHCTIAGQRCATELDHCLSNPDQPDTGCWTVCVDDTATDGDYCLSDDECVEGGCRFQADVCLDDPNSDTALCSGWCASACAEVETSATDPATGLCAVFPDSCIPPGWVRAEGC